MSTQQSSLELVRLIAAREITTKLRDRAFLISTAVMLGIVAVAVALPLWLNRDDGHPEFRLAVSGQTASLVGETAKATAEQAVKIADAQQAADDEASESDTPRLRRSGETGVPTAVITLVTAGSAEDATALVRDDHADAALVENADGTLELVGDEDVDSDLSTLVTVSTQAEQMRAVLTGAGVGQEVFAQLQNNPPPGERLLDPKSPNDGIALVLGFAFAFLFYLTGIGFGMMIAQSVVEEKQSRVIEILVSATPVRVLLAGKILGNATMALGQVALLMAIGLGAASATGQTAAAGLLLSSGGWFLLFFALGFVMLSCAWAAAGALAARQEDLQSTTVPLQMVLFAPFILAFYITDPGIGLKILSYVPFTAPLSMPRRLLIDDAAWWEALISLGIIAATGALLIAFAARLYEGSLLRTNTKTSIAAAWRREKQPSSVGD